VFNEDWRIAIPDKYLIGFVDDIPYGLNLGNMAFLERQRLVKQEAAQIKPKKTSKVVPKELGRNALMVF
jgi:hypothetical protein